MRSPHHPNWQQALIVLTGTVVVLTVVMILYWGRAVCIPLALAIFFSFVLSPLVHALQRRGLPRVPAVLVVVTGALLILSLVGFLVVQQTMSLARTLPDHADSIKDKVQRIQNQVASDDDGRLQNFINDLMAKIDGKTKPEATPTISIEPPTPGWLDKIREWISPMIEFLAQAVFALVLVIFILIKKEDLRNRLLRLIGAGRVTTATRAIDDASERVSRYLLAQAILNAGFAVVVSVALFLLRVDYAILWGILAGMMRYVPYVGGVVGVALPIISSFALSDGLWQPIAIAAMFIVVDVITGYVIEPWLYGQSMGLSPVAQLIAASVWAFLWGPIGLVLSGPLTVCLLVLGRHVRPLGFLTVLLGDEPALDPDVMLYQRLAARDVDEAEGILLEATETMSYDGICDRVLIPALSRTKQAAALGDLTEEEAQRVLVDAKHLSELLDEAMTEATAEMGEATEATEAPERVKIVFCPARDEFDQQALELLARRMKPDRWDVEVASVATLASELVQHLREDEPPLVVIGAVTPGGLEHVRYLCKRLHDQFPEMKIVVYRGGISESDGKVMKRLQDAGVEQVTSSIEGTRQYLQAWQPVLTTLAS